MSSPTPATNYTFASDNTAGICPEAWGALAEANSGTVASYGDDLWSKEATRLFCERFETEVKVHFVFNGTAANSLALAACCRSSHTRIFCHTVSHVDTDECAAPEFFTGGAKLASLPGPNAKLLPDELERALHGGAGVHYPRPGALSLTQSTEWGTVYQQQEIRALTEVARRTNLPVHMDGARFANAVAAMARELPTNARPESLLADVTWRSGVDVLCLGGTKNGMLTTEAVIFFNHDLAKEFDYRVKQGGQLASKMRFAAAQWIGMLRDGAWLSHAAHANAMARLLAEQFKTVPGAKVILPTEVNAVLVELEPPVHAALEQKGWAFYPFIRERGYRFMCSWDTTPKDVEALISDLRKPARSFG